ncbi:MAG: hypothetical protein JKY52_17410 [Flavobacteriales bacterium]|nr:hypothetical protein [Flavobacteriales bacterium]
MIQKVNNIGMSFGRAAVAATFLFYIGGCTPEGEQEVAAEKIQDPTEEADATTDNDGAINKSGKVFYTIPSPLELTSIIKKAGAKYDNSVLNSTKNISNYVTETSQALNLGVYGADLSYASIFEQTQETIVYFAAAHKLADALGITAAFGESTIERVQNNLNNRDSLVAIISDSYWETDAYLKENKRSSISGLVVAGGWLEGLYISTKLAQKTENNEGIVSRIGEQKLTLSNLIAMLRSFEDPEVTEVVADLKELKDVFADVEITYTRQAPTTDPETKVMTLNTTSTINISAEVLASITEKVDDIRTKIVN